MALLASGPFALLLLPPPPEPPPSFVFLPDPRVVRSSCYPPDPPVPPDPPDLFPYMCRFFSLAICSPESFNDSSTAVCRLCSGCYPAPSSSNMFDLPTGSRICGCSLVLLGIRRDMLFDWVCEALFPAFDSITGFLVAQSLITHFLGCLASSLSHKENEVLVVLDLESHVSVFMVIVNNLVALVVYLMEFLFALNFSLSLSDSCVWSFVLMIASRFSSSFKNMYQDAQDCPVLQGLFPAIIAEFLALLDAQVAAILLSIFKLVCKSDCQDLSRLLSESWSFDVLWILLAIRSLILSFENLSVLVFCCACNMATPLASDAFLFCMSSLNGV